ncbi:MAG: DUF86 domain-containing protein [Rikenellaceae bacterium]|jgi:uncharacterized protein with HEPN domain|nr:DUF86 domain-containing protein [Rikenellaceae bacterium]
MQQREDINKSLYDIQVAIDSIESYLAENLGKERNFYVYLQKKMLRRGVERELEIIGEATNRILKITPDFPITSARKIVDTRNYVAHGYDKVDDSIIWYIVTKHLPKLKEDIDRLLK